MDGWTDGRTDGRRDGRTNGRTDGPTFICKDSVQTKDPTYVGPVLVEQQPRCNREWDRNPTRQAIKSGPCPRFDGPPTMKVEVSSSFLLSAHVSKIFTFQIICSTYIQRNSIVQKNIRRRIWYSLHKYERTKYKPKILHT